MHRGYRRETWRRLWGRLATVVALLIVVLILAVPTRGHAQEGFNLTSSPLPIDVTTLPGVPVSTPLRVQNSGSTPVKIKVSLLKFSASGETGQPQLLPKQPEDAYMDWVTFSKTSFVAMPGVWETVTMTISPPKEAAFGYYYAVVFSQDDNTPLAQQNANRLNGATATMVLLNVTAPGEKRQLELTAFTANQKVYEYLPARFMVTVKNTGNIHTIPSGNIYVKPNSGKDLAILSINPTQGNVLPGSSRTFNPVWDDGFPVFVPRRVNGEVVTKANGVVEQQLSWDFSHTNRFRFGKYRAHLLLTYNDGTKDVPLEAEVSFWVIPWKILLALLFVALLILVGLWTIGRSLYRKFRKRRGRR